MIYYDGLIKKLAEMGCKNTYELKKMGKDAPIGQATYYAITHPESGRGLDHRSINKLCELFHCQPNDLMVWEEKEREKTTD